MVLSKYHFVNNKFKHLNGDSRLRGWFLNFSNAEVYSAYFLRPVESYLYCFCTIFGRQRQSFAERQDGYIYSKFNQALR